MLLSIIAGTQSMLLLINSHLHMVASRMLPDASIFSIYIKTQVLEKDLPKLQFLRMVRV
jgi:hypothetical protein